MGALGHRGHKQHKVKANRGHLWCLRPGFVTYGRGNFPGHHVLGCLPKFDVNRFRWVKSGTDGRGLMHWQGGKQKQGKKNPKWLRRARFVKSAQSEKPGR